MASLDKLLEDGGAPPADEEAVGKGQLAYKHPLVERYEMFITGITTTATITTTFTAAAAACGVSKRGAMGKMAKEF